MIVFVFFILFPICGRYLLNHWSLLYQFLVLVHSSLNANNTLCSSLSDLKHIVGGLVDYRGSRFLFIILFRRTNVRLNHPVVLLFLQSGIFSLWSLYLLFVSIFAFHVKNIMYFVYFFYLNLEIRIICQKLITVC